MENKIFRYAFIASLLIHIFIFWNLAYNKIRFVRAKTPRMIKVSYARPSTPQKMIQASVPEKGVKIALPQQVKAAKKEQKNISPFLKDLPKKTNNFIQVTEKPRIIDEKKVKRKVAVPPLETAEIKNPLS